MKNRDKSREKCATLLQTLRDIYLVPFISDLSPDMEFDTIEAAFVALVEEYREQSVGPAAAEILEKFIRVSNKNSHSHNKFAT